MLDALREPRYRLLWLAGLCVNAARWMDYLVLGWVALELTGSAFMVGLAAFCRLAPMLLLGMVAGVVADRYRPERVMVWVQVLNLACAVVLAGVFLAGLGSYPLLLVLEVLLGVAWVSDFPVRRSVLYGVIGPERLTNAVSLESVSMQGSKIFGPTLGGTLLALAGAGWSYMALASTYAVALVLVLALQRRVHLPPREGAWSESVFASVAGGLREAARQPVIQAVLLITILMNVLVIPYRQMLPVFARDVFSVGPEMLGWLFAVDGLGALVGALVVASRRDFARHGQLFALGSLGAATLVATFALVPWIPLALLVQFCIGAAESGFGTMQSTLVLLRSSDQGRGRIMGVLSNCIGTQPLGALWIGFAADQVGPATATVTNAVLGVLGIALVANRAGILRPQRTPAPG